MDYKEKYNAALERASKLREQNPFDDRKMNPNHLKIIEINLLYLNLVVNFDL